MANSVAPVATTLEVAVGEHLAGRSHALHLHNDQSEERHQQHPKEVVGDHAEADHGGVLPEERSYLTGRHVRGHRRTKSREGYEGDEEDGTHHGGDPKADPLGVKAVVPGPGGVRWCRLGLVHGHWPTALGSPFRRCRPPSGLAVRLGEGR